MVYPKMLSIIAALAGSTVSISFKLLQLLYRSCVVYLSTIAKVDKIGNAIMDSYGFCKCTYVDNGVHKTLNLAIGTYITFNNGSTL